MASRPVVQAQRSVLVDPAAAAGEDSRAEVDSHPMVAEQVQGIPPRAQLGVPGDRKSTV